MTAPSADAMGETTPQPVGVIGLGRMGQAAARTLVAAGFTVHGFDVSADVRGNASAAGVSTQPSPDLVAHSSDVVLLSLPNEASVDAALGTGDGVLAAPGRLIIDLSTVGPHAAADIASTTAAAGSSYVSCPVIGGESNCGKWTLIVGAERIPDVADPALAALGAATLVGSGQRACSIKVLNNLLLATSVAALAELAGLAAAAGIDLAEFQSIVSASGSVTASPLLTRVLPNAMVGAAANVFPVRLLVKDARLGLELLDSTGLNARVTADSIDLLERALTQGGGEEDFTRIILDAADSIDGRTSKVKRRPRS